MKNWIIVIFGILANGCNIYLDDHCDPHAHNYSHTEYSCHTELDEAIVCDRYRCWREPAYVEICEEVYVCYYDGDDHHHH